LKDAESESGSIEWLLLFSLALAKRRHHSTSIIQRSSSHRSH
jgi:hypothetical protein